MSSNSNIRNFSIIAHIDHGKSTLADRLLELTHTVEKRKMKEQVLDSMDLERERGITIKMQPVRMLYRASPTDADGTQTNADTELLYKDLTYKIRGACFAVRKKAGLGHKEIIYQNALAEELKQLGLKFEREKAIDICYENKKIGIYQPDFLIDDKLILELKALPFISKKEETQVWTYLKGSEYRLALLINFASDDVHMRRIVYDTARDYSQRESALSLRPSAEIEYILNLIDTPGHVDFAYEVSRSLAAVEGALLVVDATKGIQAQTIANLHFALAQNLVIIPVINKIDMPQADVIKVEAELANLLYGSSQPRDSDLEIAKSKSQITNNNQNLKFNASDAIIKVSAKTGQNVEQVLQAVIERIPPPSGRAEADLQALIFDTEYDSYRGVIAYVMIKQGSASKKDQIYLAGTGQQTEVLDLGILKPEFASRPSLSAGEIGYVVTGLKSLASVRVGDTLINAQQKTQSEKLRLPGYKQVKPVVFAGLYPKDTEQYEELRDALEKINLNDASFGFEPERSDALGPGFRAGFLGLLHLDIIKERIAREHGLEIIITTPSVEYQIKLLGQEKLLSVKRPQEFPDPASIEYVQEPWVRLEIVTPSEFIGNLMGLIQERRGDYQATNYLDPARAILRYKIPLSSILTDFYDKLKGTSRGYASMAWEFDGWRANPIVKLDIYIAETKQEALSQLIYEPEAYKAGRDTVDRLKSVLPRQMFDVKIQAALGSKIIAAERISALRKDVTAKLYGGDVTRKRKLLEKQKKGKKKMMAAGQVDIPSSVYMEILKK